MSSTVIDFAKRQGVSTIEPASAASEHPIWSVDELARIRSDPSFAAAEFQRVAKELKRAGRRLTFPDKYDRIGFDFGRLGLESLAFTSSIAHRLSAQRTAGCR